MHTSEVPRHPLRAPLRVPFSSAAVLPKVTYGLQAGGIPRTLLKKLRGAIKAALGYSHRIHSWEALCIVANPGHRLDPEAYQMYCHLSAVIRGLRDSEDAQKVWTLLHRRENVHPCWKYGPLCTVQHFLGELRISWDRGGLIWRFRHEEVHLLDTALPKTLHFLRDTIRHWLARKAQQARPHLDGLTNTDFEESRKLTKKRGYTYRKELIALLADGVWTNRKRYLCGYRQDEKCEQCGAEVENLPHILYQCPKWSTYWRSHENLREEVSKLPACASWCAHKPLELPEHLSKQWGEVQKIMATIVYERMNGEPNHWEEQRTKGKESHAERRGDEAPTPGETGR